MTEPPSAQAAPPDLNAALERLWTRFLPEIRERVSIIDSAVDALASGSLGTEQKDAARSAAHKLAGVLGTFNLSRGTDLARELEAVFSSANSLEPATAVRLAPMAAEIRSLIDSRK